MEQLQPIRREYLRAFVDYLDRSEKTTRTYLANLRAFFAWTSYSGISTPTREDLRRWREWLQTEHKGIKLDPVTGWAYTGKRTRCSAATAGQYLQTVKQFFRWTAAAGIYPDIAADVRVPRVDHTRHRKEALAPEDVRAVEAAILATDGTEEQRRRLYAMFLLAVNAGLRCVEISRANRSDLEIRRNQAWIYVTGKGHSEADTRKALAPDVYRAIRDYLRIRTDASPALFVSTGNRSGGQRIAPTTISTMLKRALRAAGYDSDRITAHSLRHTAGTAVQALTRDLYATQHYMRHASPATTEIYLHNDTEEIDAQIAAELFKYYHA